jgi:hypothetical protein
VNTAVIFTRMSGDPLIALARGGTPTIRVMEETDLWMATSDCHLKRLYEQRRILDGGQRPSSHYSRKHLKHHRKEKPSFCCPDIRRVGHPCGGRLIGAEIALK